MALGSKESWPPSLKPKVHRLVLEFDEDMQLVAYEASKNGVVKARENLPATNAGGGNVPASKHVFVDDHPGPHKNEDNTNSVDPDVAKGPNKRRAHMTFTVTGSDPCFQIGRDLICY